MRDKLHRNKCGVRIASSWIFSMISRFLILRYQCTDTRISNLIMFQTCLFPNVSQVTYLLPKVENAILTDYMCKKTTTTKYICNLICIPNGEFAFKEIYAQKVILTWLLVSSIRSCILLSPGCRYIRSHTRYDRYCRMFPRCQNAGRRTQRWGCPAR